MNTVCTNPSYEAFEDLRVDPNLLFSANTCKERSPWSMDEVYSFLGRNIAYVMREGVYLVKMYNTETGMYDHHRKTKAGVQELLSHFSFPLRAGGDGKDVPPYRGVNILKTAHIPQYSGFVFDPSSPDPRTNEIKAVYLDTRLRAYNMFKGLAITHIPEQSTWKSDLVSLFERHAFEILCNCDQESYNYLMQWVAHIFQHPGRKPGTAILMRSIQGIGKNIWWDVIGNIIGGSYCGYITHREHLEGKFNAHLENKLLVVCDEMGLGSNREIANLMKARITQQVSMIERKGCDAVKVRSFERYVWLSNEKWPVRVEETDRRWVCIQGTPIVHPRAYYQNFARFYEAPENLQAICNYFMQMQGIPVTLPLPPKTELWCELREMAQPDEIVFLKDMARGAEGMSLEQLPNGALVTATGMLCLFREWLALNGKTKSISYASVKGMGSILGKVLGPNKGTRNTHVTVPPGMSLSPTGTSYAFVFDHDKVNKS